ncbi:hypothetical protein KP509_25G002500 [Ceratopteris richardii]|uniref:Glutamine amidotransferase domain-containing protein n=1 Tax=Ceratopteris richardii TaxID=49495 RepID=A0A8T2RPU0_CERRI|nr:hypothetical protein KP509_25G002500 [Ceratopteris richardii]
MGVDILTTGIEATKCGQFAILLAGHGTEYVRETYGGVPTLIKNLLSDVDEVWDTFRVVDGEFPSDADLYKYEGFVVTGSCEDAHGSTQWVLDLCEVIRKVHRMNRKLLGICFGHQVISRALGGKTGRAINGWELGLKKIVLSNPAYPKPYIRQLPSSLSIIEVHQDEVYELPPGGEILASSDKTSVEMYAIGNQVLGVQGHPEFTKDITANIIDTYLEKHNLSDDFIARAKLTLREGEADREIFAQLCKSFLKATPCQVHPLDYELIGIDAPEAVEKSFQIIQRGQYIVS